jgi:hypothetical protein
MPNPEQVALHSETSVLEIVEDVSHTLAEVEAGTNMLEEHFPGRRWSLDQARQWVAAADACRLAAKHLESLIEAIKS